jgi:hypothetical protein
VATTPKAQLYVTVTLADLVARTNAATVFGSGEAGTLLAPETARRVACDAGIVPVVLGTHGQVLDLGRRFRLFSSAQLRALWLRDGGCTFPDCTVPASWCDGHHLRHWADGGPTHLGNAALLCGRHHTTVHTKGYHARLVDGHIQWDLTIGAYDHWLTTRHAAAADRLATQGAVGAMAWVSGPPVRRYDVWDQPETGTRATATSPPCRP